jgi:hypothetical protein
MKPLLRLAGLWFGLFSAVTAFAAAEPPALRLSAPVQTAWSAIKRTTNQTHWQSVTTRTNLVTGRLMVRTNSFVEIGGGINVPIGPNTFAPANPSFHITATGAESTGTVHEVTVPGDIWAGVASGSPNAMAKSWFCSLWESITTIRPTDALFSWIL